MATKNRNEFRLKTIKLLEKLGVEVKWFDIETKGDETNISDDTRKSPIARHQDMDVVHKKLEPHVAKIFGFQGLSAYKDVSKLKGEEKTAYEKLIDRIDVTGISISGEGESKSVVITVSYTVPTGEEIGLSTPKMLVASEMSTYPEYLEIAKIADEIEEEAFEYLFRQKRGVLELFSDNGAEEGKGDKGEEEKTEKKEELAAV